MPVERRVPGERGDRQYGVAQGDPYRVKSLGEYFPPCDQEKGRGSESLADHRRCHSASEPEARRDEQGTAGQPQRTAAEEQSDGDGHVSASRRAAHPAGQRRSPRMGSRCQWPGPQRGISGSRSHRSAVRAPRWQPSRLRRRAWPSPSISAAISVLARARDDSLRHGELHRAKRDSEHSDDVQNSAKRSVVRRAKQTADQEVEEEIESVNPRCGNHQGPATAASTPGRIRSRGLPRWRPRWPPSVSSTTAVAAGVVMLIMQPG